MIKDEKVRIICRRIDRNAPLQILRGTVLDEDGNGLKLSGRTFQQTVDEGTGRTVERPISRDTKVFFIPYTSIRFAEIIVEGTPSEGIDRKVKMERILPKGEIRKEEGLI